MTELGIFKDFWNGHPNHLPFLRLKEPINEPKDWNLKNSIDRIENILTHNSEDSIIEGIKLLLKDEDWRPHLIAMISLLKIEPSQRNKIFDLIWDRLSKGSWISPQILVVLSITDESFTAKAKKILEEGLQVNYSSLSPIEHHSFRGGANPTIAEKKIIASINHLLYNTNSDTIDSDNGGQIAKSWKEQLLKFNELGILIIKK